MMISTHRDEARLATINARIEHYLEWKDPYPHKIEDIGKSPSSQEVLIDGVCNKYNFLDHELKVCSGSLLVILGRSTNLLLTISNILSQYFKVARRWAITIEVTLPSNF